MATLEEDWRCDACTLVNPQSLYRCSVCNTPRDYAVARGRVVDAKIVSVRSELAATSGYSDTSVVDAIVAMFQPMPDMKGCNSGDTAVSEIIDGFLFLSGSHTARDTEWLKRAAVTHVLNCGGDDVIVDADTYQSRLGITVCSLPLSDTTSMSSKLLELLPSAIRLLDKWRYDYKTSTHSPMATAIDSDVHHCDSTDVASVDSTKGCVEVKKSGSKCLVHCSAGVSRSVSVVTAYLMHSQKCSLRTAFAHVRSRRSYAYPNLGFWTVLRSLDPAIDSIPETALQLHSERILA